MEIFIIKTPIYIIIDNVEYNFDNGLKKIRADKGWSTRDLASRMQISHRTIEGWESGKPPAAKLIVLLEKILNDNV